MAKAGQFKTTPREEPVSRDPKLRIRDFEEIHPSSKDDMAETQSTRCMECGIPFCHDSFGCPIDNLIPEWHNLLSEGRWEEAVNRMLETDAFPEFTGRICPAPCEGACTMGHYNDSPVTIRQTEYALATKGWEEGWIKPLPPKHRTGKKVAVIGSGPAGLASAFYLNRLGHEVTIYEKAQKAGGLLRYGIPNYKLDKIKIVERRINFLKEEGIIFETGVEIGKDISGQYLKKNFDSICIATGAEKPRDLPIPGRDLNGVHFAMEFLSRQSMKLEGEALPNGIDITAKDKNVIIIGGGDTGSDCLGTSHRQGAKNIVQVEIVPMSPEKRADNNPWPNWPFIFRTSSSHKEGGERMFSVMTKEFIGDEKGQVKKLKCVKVEMKMDPKKGMQFIEEKGSEFELEADLVLLAMGFLGPIHEGLLDSLEIEYDARSNVIADKNQMTSQEGIFVCGDATTGQSLVVRAIASGRDVANSIHEYLMVPASV